jgi:hypothetical protein
MGLSTVVGLPRSGREPGRAADAALSEIEMAIALVTAGSAVRVRLTALPFVESIAAVGLARARAARVGFRLERGERVGVTTITIGPLDRILRSRAD